MIIQTANWKFGCDSEQVENIYNFIKSRKINIFVVHLKKIPDESNNTGRRHRQPT